jgi:hypothetical protein
VHLVVGAGPGGHLHSVDHLFDIDHLKHGEKVPDADPHIANHREVNVVECVDNHAQKHTCSPTRRSCQQAMTVRKGRSTFLLKIKPLKNPFRKAARWQKDSKVPCAL